LPGNWKVFTDTGAKAAAAVSSLLFLDFAKYYFMVVIFLREAVVAFSLSIPSPSDALSLARDIYESR
jgi:hypothetical protein